CPGLNAVIRAVCRRLWEHGHETIAVLNGWRGMVDTNLEPLGWDETSGILHKGGTIIGTSRTNPYKLDGGVDGVRKTFEQLDALVAIGGEDTLGVAARLSSELDLPVVGVPKTIDNDLNGTDYTFGFDTAVYVATDAVDRCHSTAESHNRILVVETMGRHAGWIALFSGIAGGADYILIPEQEVKFDDVAAAVERRRSRGKNFSVIVASEGCELPGVADEGEVEDFGGRASTGEAAVSIARMTSPAGWEEPAQAPDFDEYTLVLAGRLVVEHDGGRLEVGPGETVHSRPGERVRYSTPDGAEYLAICVPAFSP